jgi:hypothetical protein
MGWPLAPEPRVQSRGRRARVSRIRQGHPETRLAFSSKGFPVRGRSRLPPQSCTVRTFRRAVFRNLLRCCIVSGDGETAVLCRTSTAQVTAQERHGAGSLLAAVGVQDRQACFVVTPGPSHGRFDRELERLPQLLFSEQLAATIQRRLPVWHGVCSFRDQVYLRRSTVRLTREIDPVNSLSTDWGHALVVRSRGCHRGDEVKSFMWIARVEHNGGIDEFP